MPAAGGSGTALARKLGIVAGTFLLQRHAPPDYLHLLAPLPGDVRIATRADTSVDVAHVFATSAAALERGLAAMRKALRADAALWISWPKKPPAW